MRNIILGLMLFSMMIGKAIAAETMEKKAEKLIESVQNGCKKEITTYCKEVTPGEGRLIACLYAFSDKLSGQCEYALYDAAAQLQQAVVKLTYLSNECSADLEKYCANVEMGQGRIINCLKKNKITERCSQALKDTTK